MQHAKVTVMRRIITTCAVFLALTGSAYAQSNQNSSIDSNTEVFTGLSMTSESPDSVSTTPGVYPPGMDAGTNSCANSVSGGASVTGFGLALGGVYENEDCQDRNWFALLTSRGMNKEAVAYACLNNEKIARALRAAGHECPEPEGKQYSSHSEVPPYCDDGGFASASKIAENCPNARRIIEQRGW
jgi:hypothetical protein